MRQGFIKELIQGVTSTVVGGIILALIFFILSDVLFAPHDLNGKWIVEVTIKDTKHNNFKNLRLKFVVMLEQNGENLFGIAEKDSEINAEGERKDFTGKSRILSTVKGHIDKRYFLSDNATAQFAEKGLIRDSTVIQSLVIHNAKKMTGKFYSTVPDSSGVVEWNKVS